MKVPVYTIALICVMLAGCQGTGEIPAISEDEYIEIVASFNVLDEMHRAVQSDIRRSVTEFGSDSMERQTKVANWVTDEFMRETQEVLARYGISIDSVREFERNNPYFMENPENLRRIRERINKLIQDPEN